MRIRPEDQKLITAEARRVTKKKRVRVEIRKCWIEADDASNPDTTIDYTESTFNVDGVTVVDVDDNYSYRYNYAEFNKFSKEDPRCDLPVVMLDICIGVDPDCFGDWEFGDFINPIFENGRLVRFHNAQP